MGQKSDWAVTVRLSRIRLVPDWPSQELPVRLARQSVRLAFDYPVRGMLFSVVLVSTLLVFVNALLVLVSTC